MNKNEVLKSISELTKDGTLTRSEVESAIYNNADKKPEVLPNENPNKHKLTAVEVLYNIGALVIFASIVALLSTVWEDIGSSLRVLFSLGFGLLILAISYWLIRKTKKEQEESVGSALLLTGSLATGMGLFIATAEITGGFNEDNSGPLITLLLATLSSFFFGLDLRLKQTVLIVFSALLSVATYYSFVTWMLDDVIDSPDFWGLVVASGGFMLISIGYFIHKYDKTREYIKTPLQSLGGFIILGSLYGLAMGSEYDLVWTILFPGALYLMFMASIKLRSKSFLFSGAFFLFIYVISIAIKYFGEGLGLPLALLLSGLGIIGSGILVQNIRKKYF